MTQIFGCTHCDVHIATDEDLDGISCDHCRTGNLFLLKKEEPMLNSNPSSNAFPIVLPEHIEPGLSKREYFAAMALQGLIAIPQYGEMAGSEVASTAVYLADQLIEQLNKADDDT